MSTLCEGPIACGMADLAKTATSEYKTMKFDTSAAYEDKKTECEPKFDKYGLTDKLSTNFEKRRTISVSEALAALKSKKNRGKFVTPPNMESVEVLADSPFHKQMIQVGNCMLEYGKMIGEMRDSTDLWKAKDSEGLRKRLEEDGFLFVKGVIPYERAQKCRMKLLEHLASKDAFEDGTPIEDAIIKNPKEGGWTVDAESGGFVFNREPDSAIRGWREIGWSDEVRSVYAGDDLRNFYRLLFGPERTNTTDGFKMLSEVTWLRAKGKGEVTAEHTDYYYFKENTSVYKDNRHPYVAGYSAEEKKAYAENSAKDDDGVHIRCDLCARVFERAKVTPKLPADWCKEQNGEWHCEDCARQPFPFYTCWISLGNYQSGNSSLCVMPKSQCLTEFHNPLKGNQLPHDFTTLVKNKWGWYRAEITIGDIIIFNVKTVHAASKNISPSFRLSIDTRVSSNWFRPQCLYGSGEAAKRLAPERLSDEFLKTYVPPPPPAKKEDFADEFDDSDDDASIGKKRKPVAMGMGMGMSMGMGMAAVKRPIKRAAMR